MLFFRSSVVVYAVPGGGTHWLPGRRRESLTRLEPMSAKILDGDRARLAERREFAVEAREDELVLRERLADEREAAADEREHLVDEHAREWGHLDEAAAADRARAREERAQARVERARSREEGAGPGYQGKKPAVVSADFPLAARFAELATALFAAGTVGGVLDHLVVVATRVVDGAEAASVSLRGGRGELSSPAYSEALAFDCDQMQYRHGEGPCVAAAASPGPAFSASADLQDEGAWPVFAPAAAAAGARAVCSFGMFPDPEEEFPRLGALNLYARRPHVFDGGSRDVGMLLAAHASVALASVSALEAASLEAAQLTQGLRSRDVIGQAKGILMERRGFTAERAYDTLRDASNRLNVKLNEVAARLTETGEEPPPRRR